MFHVTAVVSTAVSFLVAPSFIAVAALLYASAVRRWPLPGPSCCRRRHARRLHVQRPVSHRLGPWTCHPARDRRGVPLLATVEGTIGGREPDFDIVVETRRFAADHTSAVIWVAL